MAGAARHGLNSAPVNAREAWPLHTWVAAGEEAQAAVAEGAEGVVAAVAPAAVAAGVAGAPAAAVVVALAEVGEAPSVEAPWAVV